MTSRSGIQGIWGRAVGLAPGLRFRLAMVVGASFAAGLAEAAVLVAVARLAVALSEGESSVILGRGVSLTTTEAVALCLAAIAAKFVLALLAARAATSAVGRTLTATRVALVSEFLNAGWPTQSRQRPGDLQELVTTHADRCAAFVSAFSFVINASLNLLVLVAIAVVVDARAAMVTVVAGLLLSLCVRPISARARTTAQDQSVAGRLFASKVTEAVGLARELDVFGTHHPVIQRLRAFNAAQVKLYMRGRLLASLTPQAYQAGALAAIVVGLGVLSESGAASLEEVGPVVLLLLRAISYGQQMQASLHSVHESSPYVDEVRKQRAEFRASAASAGTSPVATVGDLELRSVGFAYPGGEPVLRNVSLRIQRGEMLGIIGPSGSGKSTLLQLLLRLRDPTEGLIVADGRPISNFLLSDWAARVAFVPQEPRLFAGTVAENIAFFREFDREAVVDAATRAGLHDEICLLPNRYDEQLGPDTRSLSGGQQQRLCIARALVGSPELVVLDEPTSALDARSEERVHKAITALRGRVTVLIVAHRLTTVASCDRVLVLTGGEVQAVGPHHALLRSSPYYAEALRLSTIDVPES